MSESEPRTRRTLLFAAAGILAATGATLIVGGRPPATTTTGTAVERAAALSRRHGLLVTVDDPATVRVDGEAATAVAGVRLAPAAEEALGPALDGLEAALAVYPDGFVAKLARAVVIVGDLRIDGTPAGGTYGRSWIILSAPPGLDAASIRETCRLGLHHELSSFVWRGSATVGAWREAMPAGWREAATTEEQLEAARTPPPRSDSGFLSAYGATTLENDFNTYAERMMTDPAGLASLAKRFKVARRKATLVREAYVDVDRRMDAILPRFSP